MSDRVTKLLLLAILILALGLRIYKLDMVPPSISWDEAAVGVNAWTIANYGRDEYGRHFPLYFRSFGDDKHPVHFYATAIFVKLLGLNEFSTRVPSAIFGVLNTLLIFFLAKALFSSNFIGLTSALFLAISPYNIHFSRFNHEANFMLFFFMLGLTFFYFFLKKRGIFLPLSVLSFGISFISYHPAKIIVPVVLLLLFILYIKNILKKRNQILDRNQFLGSIFILFVFAAIIVSNPQLLGLARVHQTLQKGKEVEEIGRLNLIFNQYLWHFIPEYLFIIGDKNPRLSSQTGQFYKIDAVFLFLGLLYLLYKRSRSGFILLAWAVIAPIPSALVAEAPHAARASFMMGSWHIISALGFYFLINIFKKQIVKWVIIAVVLLILTVSCINYLRYYFGEYVTRYAIEWQYGMKQIVEYIKEHNEYNEVYMTDIRSQPYIFFLFYLQTPLPEYLRGVLYNNSESKSYNTVSNFGRYYFSGWNLLESLPIPKVLYIVTPSQYDGLKHKNKFDVKKIIYYPNSTTAFYLVSSYE